MDKDQLRLPRKKIAQVREDVINAVGAAGLCDRRVGPAHQPDDLHVLAVTQQRQIDPVGDAAETDDPDAHGDQGTRPLARIS
jgi:hypothetical protein